LAGFAEWLAGAGRETGGDIASAPIIMGMGVTATDMGLGLVEGCHDGDKLAKLTREFQVVPAMIQRLAFGGLSLGWR